MYSNNYRSYCEYRLFTACIMYHEHVAWGCCKPKISVGGAGDGSVDLSYIWKRWAHYESGKMTRERWCGKTQACPEIEPKGQWELPGKLQNIPYTWIVKIGTHPINSLKTLALTQLRLNWQGNVNLDFKGQQMVGTKCGCNFAM